MDKKTITGKTQKKEKGKRDKKEYSYMRLLARRGSGGSS
jgi:starvation-inducible outer membrane lipoprotein